MLTEFTTKLYRFEYIRVASTNYHHVAKHLEMGIRAFDRRILCMCFCNRNHFVIRNSEMQSVLESISSSAKRWFVSMYLALRERLFVSLSALKLQFRLEPNFVDGKLWNEQNKHTRFMLQPQCMRCRHHSNSVKRKRTEGNCHTQKMFVHLRKKTIFSSYISFSPFDAIVICHKVNSPHCLHSNWISFIASDALCRWTNSFDFLFKRFETISSYPSIRYGISSTQP